MWALGVIIIPCWPTWWPCPAWSNWAGHRRSNAREEGYVMHTDVKLVSISGMMFWSVGTCSRRLEERNALLEGVRELEELEKSRCRK